MPLDGKNYQPCENAKILREAANIIRKYGHIKDTFGNKDVGFCLRGAIQEVVGRDIPYTKIVADYLYEQGINLYDRNSCDWGNAPRWNNEPKRTKEEVIDVLEKAAIFAEEKVIA